LSIIAAAALREHPEIGPILEKHNFRQGEYAWQFYTKLSAKDMEAIVQDLVLTNSLNIWFAEEASEEWPHFLRGLRAHLLRASNSIHIEPRVIKHMGELTTVVLDVHPEIRSILETYGPLQGSSADHLYTGLSSEDMLALANDLLPTIHAGSMLCPKVSSEVKVEDIKDTTWKQPGKDMCFVSGCNDMADKVVYDKVMIRHICNCGCKERPEYAFCEDHFTKFKERQKYSFCKEHFIQLMFEEMVSKDNRVICISEDQSEKAEILAGKYGHQAKQFLAWWIANSISTAIDEAKQYSEQESSIEAIRFQRFDSHYRKMRSLFVTHLQLLNTTGPDNFHLFALYSRDEDQSEILPRMEDLRISYAGYFHSESQTVNEVITVEPVEDTEETAQWRHERVFVMVMEHEGKPLNKPGIITFVHLDDDYTVKMNYNFQQIRVSGDSMTRMDVHKGNEIIVISGEHKGKIGQLDEIIDEDGLIKLKWLPDGNAIPDDIDSIQIEEMWKLCLCGSTRDERKNPTRGESEYLGYVEPAELGPHLDFSHDASENERQLHICFTAEYTIFPIPEITTYWIQDTGETPATRLSR
jgi:hypothetical protein